MEKLDAKFYGTIRKVKDNSIVPDDEYVVFLAKDNAFATTLVDYYWKCVAHKADEEQLDAVKRLVDRVMRWRDANPDRCQVPGAKGEKLLDQP